MMSNSTLVALGVISAVTFVSTTYALLERFVKWLAGWVVVTQKMDDEDANYFLSFLCETCSRVRSDSGTYVLNDTYVRPRAARYPVVHERLALSSQVFRRGARFLRYAPVGGGDDKIYSRSFSYLRGTWDWDVLTRDFTRWKAEKDADRAGRRFAIHYRFGMDRDNKSEAPAVVAHYDPASAYSGRRLLGGWTFDDLRPPAPATSFAKMSLAPELVAVHAEWKKWLGSKQWYRERGVPYRRGYAFVGPPGTGKTTAVRAFCEDLDLPVFVFDLSSMSNKDLYTAWRSMGGVSPCVALLEDLDGIFEGRKNISASALIGGVTFDALLNVLDGVESLEGVLVVISTNHPDRLDDALMKRPGRVDRRVDFRSLDHEGRVKMATRILGPGREREALVLATSRLSDSAARFQEECVRAASRDVFETDDPYRGDAG